LLANAKTAMKRNNSNALLGNAKTAMKTSSEKRAANVLILNAKNILAFGYYMVLPYDLVELS
jgi:hypothetical protein